MMKSREPFSSKILKMPGKGYILRWALLISIIISIFLVIRHTAFYPSPTSTYLNLPTRFFTYCPPSGAAQLSCHPSEAYATNSITEPTDITHIQFGLSGSSQTWSHRRQYTHLWWEPNKTRGYVFLDAEPPKNLTWSESSPPYKVSTQPQNYKPSKFAGSDRIARIIKESYDMRLSDVRWFVMGDDDTLFFKENLVTILSRYDHNEMYYIGMSSESVEQNVWHSYNTAFGGAGFVISYGLARELGKVLDGCIQRYGWLFGSDEKVSSCVAELGVSMTRQPGFHQLDVKGDAYGFLAAHPVAPLVTLHHLDTINPLFPGQTQLDSLKRLMEAYDADPGRTIQQSICYDYKRKWSVSISWGYTVQIYPKVIAPRELEKPLMTFRTWKSLSEGPFMFSTRPWKEDPCQRPLIYFLDKVDRVVGGEGTATTYKRAAVDFDGEVGKVCGHLDYKRAMAVEKIVVNAEKMGYQEWMKVPRRQCCEVITNGTTNTKNEMSVRVRACGPTEAITAR